LAPRALAVGSGGLDAFRYTRNRRREKRLVLLGKIGVQFRPGRGERIAYWRGPYILRRRWLRRRALFG